MNRKKHTKLKNNIYKFFTFISVLFIFGCSMKGTTPPPTIPIPTKQESVISHLQKIDKNIQDSIITNTKIEEKVKQQRDEITKQKLDITDALAQAEKIKERAIANELVTEIEAISLIESIKKIETRNLFLETQIEELAQIRKEQEIILNTSKSDYMVALNKLKLKEEEAETLRYALEASNKNIQDVNETNNKLLSDLNKEKIKSAKATVYKNWVIGLVSGFVLWIIVKNILMIYFPLAKFRV